MLPLWRGPAAIRSHGGPAPEEPRCRGGRRSPTHRTSTWCGASGQRIIDYTTSFAADQQRYDLVLEHSWREPFGRCSDAEGREDDLFSSDLGRAVADPDPRVITPLLGGRKPTDADPAEAGAGGLRSLEGLLKSLEFGADDGPPVSLGQIVEAYRYVETGEISQATFVVTVEEPWHAASHGEHSMAVSAASKDRVLGRLGFPRTSRGIGSSGGDRLVPRAPRPVRRHGARPAGRAGRASEDRAVPGRDRGAPAIGRALAVPVPRAARLRGDPRRRPPRRPHRRGRGVRGMVSAGRVQPDRDGTRSRGLDLLPHRARRREGGSRDIERDDVRGLLARSAGSSTSRATGTRVQPTGTGRSARSCAGLRSRARREPRSPRLRS